MEEIPEEWASNQSYIKTVMEDDEFEDYRKNTKFDEISSALSTISFGNKVSEWIQEQKQEDENFNKAVQQTLEAQQQQQQTGRQSDQD